MGSRPQQRFASQRTRHSRNPQQRRLRVEALEERRMLSITVNTLVDELDGSIVDGDISLRDAVAVASSGETIDFDASLDGGTILLTLGQMLINDALTIDASSLASGLTIEADGNTRIFRITDGAETTIDVEIRGLTLTGGFNSFSGGAIFSLENLTVADSVITGNSATFFGGGIYAKGTTAITGSTISNNSTTDDFGGITSGGGGVWNSGPMTISNSTFSSNSTAVSGGAIISSSLGITDSAFSDNSAVDGGGIFIIGGTATITGSTISGNSASSAGGGLRVNGVAIITDSTISDNTAGTGGGVWGDETTMIISSTITGNSANSGGGASFAGEDVTISNSTISGNTAVTKGGGIAAVSHHLGPFRVYHSTITNNSAGTTGGGIHVEDNGFVLATFDHTIVAENITTGDLPTSDDVFGPVEVTFSLIGDGTGATITDSGGNLIGTNVAPIDPHLAPLADNGGPTQTHGLIFGSPALDAGDPTAVAGVGSVPLYGQRGSGFDRVVDIGAGAIIDMGAYEAQTTPLEADLDLDGLVNGSDFAIIADNFGPTSGGYADGNLNGDAYVDAADIGIMFAAWTGDTGPTAASSISSTDSVQANRTSNSLAGNRQLPVSNFKISRQATVAAVDEQHHQETLLLNDAEQQQGSRRWSFAFAGNKDSIGEIASQKAEQADHSAVDEAILSLVDEEEWFGIK